MAEVPPAEQAVAKLVNRQFQEHHLEVPLHHGTSEMLDCAVKIRVGGNNKMQRYIFGMDVHEGGTFWIYDLEIVSHVSVCFVSA